MNKSVNKLPTADDFVRSFSFNFILVLIAVFTAQEARAVNYTWDGGGTGGNQHKWSAKQNWGGNVFGSGDNAIFTSVVGNSATPTVDTAISANSITYNSGAASFTIINSGGNTLTLGGGGITNNAANAQVINSALALGAAQTWRLNSGSLTIGGTFNLGANQLTLTNTGTVLFTNTVSGSGGSVIKTGSGLLGIGGSAANTFTGGFTVNAGSVQAYKANAFGTNANLTLNGGTTDILTNSQNIGTGTLILDGGTLTGSSGVMTASAFDIRSGTISAKLGGSGTLTKSTSGTATLSSGNSYSGGTILNAGTLNASAANALGTGALTVNGGTLDIAGNNQSVGTVTLAGGIITGTSGIITGSTYAVQSGTINARLAGAVAMTKSTAGTVTLTSSNLFTGNTTINAGKLAVNNTSGSGLGSGNVIINSSGTLAGTGTITGNVTNNAGGRISAGDVNLISAFASGSQTWAGGATNYWEIKDVDSGEGVGWDKLTISGGLNLTATSGNKFIIDLRTLTLANTAGLIHDFDSSQSYIWTIARTVTGITFGAGESESTVFQLLLGGFANSLDGGTLTIALGNSGKDLNVVFTPAAVPEPTALAILGFGVALFCTRSRNLRR